MRRFYASELMETSDVHIRGNFIKSVILRGLFNELPVSFGVALERDLSKFKLRVGDSGVFLPDIVQCCARSSGFNVGSISSKSFADTQRDGLSKV